MLGRSLLSWIFTLRNKDHKQQRLANNIITELHLSKGRQTKLVTAEGFKEVKLPVLGFQRIPKCNPLIHVNLQVIRFYIWWALK